MDYLWKKESAAPDALYVDYFGVIETDYKVEFINRLLYAVQNSTQKAQKSNVESFLFLRLGQEMARSWKWRDAAEFFNSSLCMAENGSLSMKLAYISRAECFLNRNLVRRASVDVNLAIDFAPPEKMFMCSDHQKKASLSTVSDPKLSFEAHKTFPCMANALEVKQNTKFGRYIVAKCCIEIGQVIVVAKKFASAVYSYQPNQAYCLTCQKTDANFIACEKCTSVMFCSRKCQRNNNVHQLECGSIFHQITSSKVKLAIQLVLIAVKQFQSADALIEFVAGILNDTPSSDMKRLAIETHHQYEFLLKLSGLPYETDIYLSYQAFEVTMTIPAIKSWFNSVKKQQFLKHLLVHHLAIIRFNSFREYFGANESLESSCIFDAIPLFNHSCAPNVFYSTKNKTGYLTTIRPIKKGDQIFINYLADQVDEPKHERNKLLMDKWGFRCECERCIPFISRLDMLIHEKGIMEHEAFNYISNHYDDCKLPFDSEERTHLKEKCAKILTDYGHYWSKSLDQVTKCFVLSSLAS